MENYLPFLTLERVSPWPDEQTDKVYLRVILLRDHHLVVHLDDRGPESRGRKRRFGDFEALYPSRRKRKRQGKPGIIVAN